MTEAAQTLMQVRTALIAQLDHLSEHNQRAGLQRAFEIVEALSRQQDRTPQTVHVRVAVAVDTEGAWNACGWSEGNDEQASSIARDTVGQGEACYFLTADLPVPASRDVEARVEN